MKRLLPGWTELAWLSGLALVCALVVSLASRRDVALMMGGMPLFFVGAMMGYRRNQMLQAEQLDAPAEGDEGR